VAIPAIFLLGACSLRFYFEEFNEVGKFKLAAAAKALLLAMGMSVALVDVTAS
jgi:hypothetical protein